LFALEKPAFGNISGVIVLNLLLVPFQSENGIDATLADAT
jgi:hypothetical protein